MKEKVGQVFSITKENTPVEGCTISKTILDGPNYISYFSMAENTDISIEIFPYHKLIIVLEGRLEVYGKDFDSSLLDVNDSIITPINLAVGMKTNKGAIFIEIALNKEDFMNSKIKAGEVFNLKELIPYQEGKIINMDVVHNEKMKFMIMSFDKGTGLSEHSAPGEALVFILDGECKIIYEGAEHLVKAGENFHFAKGGRHALKATEKFKMALLLTLE